MIHTGDMSRMNILSSIGIRLLRACTGGLWLLITGVGLAAPGGPEAIVSTNTLPPSSGKYQVWPPNSQVNFNGTVSYIGTNYPAIFHLTEIEAGPFTNTVRTVAGDDLILEFDAYMNTHVPYMELTQTVLRNVALYDQIGHFIIRVHGGAKPATNWLALTVESLSWTYQGRSAAGTNFDFIHVRNSPNQVSSGWIETTPLPAGGYVMRSELLVYPEGVVLSPPGMNPPLQMNYVAAERSPVRLALRGVARKLEVLYAATKGDEFVLYNTYLGPAYRYGLDYTTNGVDWTTFSIRTVYGDTQRWFDTLEEWSDQLTNAPMRWCRLKAQLR